MPITDILERNCKLYGDDVCLVEVNPEVKENRRVTWKEYELIESNSPSYYRREITWNVFNEKANRFANLLIQRGIKKGDKVAMVCLSWGGIGDKQFIHKYCIAKERLKNEFGLELVPMANALKGSKYIYEHPEERAKDLMDAFKDSSIAIFQSPFTYIVL